MKHKAAIAGAVALATALALGLCWRGAASGGAADAASTATPGAQETAAAAPTATTAGVDPLLTGSLRGTEVDGEVRFDDAGLPVADAGLRRFFDYHLSLIGELDIAGIRARLRQTLAARFDPARIERVMAYFDRYVAYQEALARAAIGNDPDPARRLDAAKRLRREVLGEAMAEGFFAEEEALAELSLRRMRIAADPALGADAKREALRALDEEAGYDARAAAELAQLAAEQAADIERRKLTPAQRDAERAALWGPEAAQRLAALDAEQANWDARVRDYAAARARIDRDPRLDAAARAQAVARLRAQMFAPNEQRRIASLEAVGQLEATLSR